MSALTLGLIGHGAIARQLADFCAAGRTDLRIAGVLTRAGAAAASHPYPLVDDLRALLDRKPSLVVECAGHQAVHQYGARILGAGIDLVLVSTGALCDEGLLFELRRAEAAGGARLILASGALPGMETLQTAALAGLQSVMLTSSKPPRAWLGTPAEEKCDLANLTSSAVIFDGSAREAARLYPRNANIAATAALAGIGFEKTRIVLVADPGLSQNMHRLEAQGAFGQLSMEIKANPSPDNPKTSLIAALSVLRVLEREAAIRRTGQARSPVCILHNPGADQRKVIGKAG